jgi:hypothetical protein
LTFFAADGSGRHVPSYNQPPSFPSTQPRPPEAALKGCGCVSANNHAHKNTGRFSGAYLFFTFVINTTHSTWIELIELMSAGYFL